VAPQITRPLPHQTNQQTLNDTVPLVGLVALGITIGALVGLIGAGGSILAVPGLIAVLGLPMNEATLSGAVIVGSASVAGFVRRRTTESINVRAGVVFSATGLLGAIVGVRLATLIDERIVVYAFSLVVLAAAASMWRSVPPNGKVWGGRWRTVLIASGVGALTGLFGIGGGFMIVPALVLGMGLSVRKASGASLVAISLNSAVVLLLRADQWGTLQLGPVGLVATLAIGTAFLITPLAERIPAGALRRGFAIFLIGVAIILVVE